MLSFWGLECTWKDCNIRERLVKSVQGVKKIDESDRTSWNTFHAARRQKRHIRSDCTPYALEQGYYIFISRWELNRVFTSKIVFLQQRS
jgi:hypothetical protein